MKKHFLAAIGWTIFFAASSAAQPLTIKGSILIAAPAGQQPDEFAGGHFQVELWRVSYAPDKKDPNVTDIRLLQRVTANINVRLAQGGLQYSIDRTAFVTGLAIIVYAGNQPQNSPLRILGRPDDGHSASKLHSYIADAKKVLGNNIAFGIYSLTNQGLAGTSIDFRVRKVSATPGRPQTFDVFGDIGNAVGDLVDDASNAVKKIVNGVEHTFDQTIDGVSGLAKCAVNDIQGIADAANFFIDEAGKFYYLTQAGLINLILYGNLPRTRDITDQEYAWANAMVYNGTLPRKDKIKIFNFMHLAGDNHRYFTWPAPVGDYIYVNIGDAFDDPMHFTNGTYAAPGQVFIHELGHAWQCGKYGLSGMVQRYFSAPGGLSQTYDPGCAVNNLNSNFNIEQQATLIDRSYAALYYPEKNESYICPFSIAWVEHNVRNGIVFDRNTILAARQMTAVAGAVGGPATGQTFHSGGNPTDGDGYFMVGRTNNSFLYFSNKTRVAAANWGVIRDRFAQANYEFGPLGWPASVEVLLPDGVGYFEKFDHGFIYWHPKYGAFVIMNNIFAPWAKGGWEKGKLGYPVSNLINGANGQGYQKFAGGVIFLDPPPAGKPGEPTTSIRYGNPDAILKESFKLNAGVREMINPQPLPPRVAPKKAYLHE